ncbi:MAG: hypothetical protein A3J28_04480 [Acidobacteria bacterium RIFCSPLOWO2_12_FULL_60_22]|nr:MAG: hypothetical protein A3J28_04480 [Acidobacteria bacterium RIFCSPLOWO2_12_FULL_60_22]
MASATLMNTEHSSSFIISKVISATLHWDTTDCLFLDLFSSRYVTLGGIVRRGGNIEDSYRVEEAWELTTTAVVAHF